MGPPWPSSAALCAAVLAVISAPQLGCGAETGFQLVADGGLADPDAGELTDGADGATTDGGQRADAGAPDAGPGDGGDGDGGDGADAGPADGGGLGDGGPADAGDTDVDGGPGDGGSPVLGPPYPIVLAHGFFGFEAFAGLDFASYFYRVRDRLAEDGELDVFTPAVDPFNGSEVRGAELLAAVEAIIADTGYPKVNIVAHSQGGLDARWVAHHRPDLVASVTTFSTPHQGTPVADVILGLIADEQAQDIIDWFVRFVGQPLWDELGAETSLFAPLRLFSRDGAAEFNASFPDAPEVQYFSIAGRSDRHLGLLDCDVLRPPAFIDEWQWERDPIDPALALTESFLDGGLVPMYANDGLVRVADAKWGAFLGCVPADHLDEIGHLFGDRPGLFNSWRHDEFYADLVAWLRTQGL